MAWPSVDFSVPNENLLSEAKLEELAVLGGDPRYHMEGTVERLCKVGEYNH